MNEFELDIIDTAINEADRIKDYLISALTISRNNTRGLTDAEKRAMMDDLVDKALEALDDNVIAVLSRA